MAANKKVRAGNSGAGKIFGLRRIFHKGAASAQSYRNRHTANPKNAAA